MTEFLNLEELLEPESYGILKLLTQAAFLDPDQEVREAAIVALRTRYDGIFLKGYVTDSRLMLTVKGNPQKEAYVCDIPSNYLDQPAKPIPFEIENILN